MKIQKSFVCFWEHWELFLKNIINNWELFSKTIINNYFLKTVHHYFVWFMMKQSLHYCLSCYSSSIHYERERERESTPCRPDWCWSNMQRWRNVGNGSLRYPSNICTVSGLAAIMCMASYIPRCWPFNSLAIRQII